MRGHLKARHNDLQSSSRPGLQPDPPPRSQQPARSACPALAPAPRSPLPGAEGLGVRTDCSCGKIKDNIPFLLPQTDWALNPFLALKSKTPSPLGAGLRGPCTVVEAHASLGRVARPHRPAPDILGSAACPRTGASSACAGKRVLDELELSEIWNESKVCGKIFANLADGCAISDRAVP